MARQTVTGARGGALSFRRAGAVLAAFGPAATAATAAEPAARLEGRQVLEGGAETGFDVVRAAVGEAAGPIEGLGQARRRAAVAAERVDAALRSEGYYAGRVTPRAEAGPAGAEAQPTAVVAVEPGARFVFGPAVVGFAPAPPRAVAPGGADPAEITVTAVDWRAGGPARAAEVVAAEARGLDALRDAGFPDARAGERLVTVQHPETRVDVAFTYEPGRPARFGSVTTSGDAPIRGRWVERLAPFETGDPYSPEALATLADRVRATGAFASVAARLAPGAEDGQPDAPAETRDVIVEIEAGAPRTLTVGVRYATSEGIGAEARWTRRNALGRGETLTAATRLGALERTLDVAIAAPHVRRVGRTLTAEARLADRTTDGFDARLLGVGANLAQPLGRDWSGRIGGDLEAVETTAPGESPQQFAVAAGLLGVDLDRTDDRLDPRAGRRLDLAARPTATFGDVSTTYADLAARGSVYASPTDSMTYAGRVRLGAVVGPGRDDVPADRRLYAGGGGSVRGYDFQSASPLDASGAPEGGLSVVELSAEARWRGPRKLGAVAFVDAGAASVGATPSLDDVRVGAGVGLRYDLGFAPLRLDVATPLDPREGDNPVQVYIGLGQAF